jgi:GAF domain-containing protein
LILSRDPDVLPRQIAASAASLLGADIVVLYEYREEIDDVVVPPVIHGDIHYPEVLSATSQMRPHKKSAVFRMLEREAPFYAPDAREDWGRLIADWPVGEDGQTFVHREDISSSAAVTLLGGEGRVMGVLFANYRTPRDFEVEERKVIELFATQAAAAIQNARLLSDLRRQAQGHRTLNRVGAMLSGLLEEDRILSPVARAAADTLDCAHCTVFRVEGDHLVVRAAEGNRGWSLSLGRKFSLDRGVAGWVARKGRPTLVADTASDHRFEAGWSTPQPDPKSLVVAPIFVHDEVYGVISVEHDRMAAFDEYDEQLLEILALQISQAVRNAELYAELRERIEDLEVLNEAGRLISGKLQIDELFETLLDMVNRTLRCAHSTLFVVDSEGVLVARMRRGASPRDLTDLRYRFGEGLAGWVAERRKSLIVANVDEDPRAVPGQTIPPGLPHSILLTPLLRRDNEVIGVISVDKRELGGFDEDDRRLLETLAAQAAIAYENADMFAQLDQRARELALLYEVSAKLTTLDLDELLALIVKGALRLTSTEAGVIYLLSGDGTAILKTVAYPPGIVHPRFHTSEQGLTRHIFQTGEPVFVPDTEQDDRVDEDVIDLGIRSFIGQPLKAGDRVIGVLYLNDTSLRRFDEREQSLISTLAHQAAVAIQNARHFADAQRRIRDLEIINKVTQVISKKLKTKDLLATIASEIAEELDCSHCTIFLPEGEELLVPQVTFGEGGKLIMTRRFRQDEGLAGWVFRHRESVVLDNASDDPRFAAARRKRGEPRSMLVAPITIGDRAVGIISADQDAFGWFSESDRRLVDALAQQAGIAIERSMGLELLEDVGNRIISAQKVEEVLHHIVAGAIKLTHTTSGVIYLIDDEGESVVESFEYPPDFDHPLPRMTSPGGITRQVVSGGQMLVFPNVREDPRTNPDLYDRIESMIAVPLKSEQRVLGVLYLNDEEHHDFTETEVSLLTTVASQAAIAIKNARLYERRAEDVAALQEVNRAIGSGSWSEIAELIREKAKELAQADTSAFWLVDRDHLVPATRYEEAVHEEVPLYALPIDQNSINGWVAMTGDPYLCPDVRDDPHVQDPPENVLSCMAVPLKWGRDPIGTLSVESAQPNAFSEYRLGLLQSLADQAAIAIENVKLYQDLERSVRELRVLNEIGRTVSNLGIDQILDLVYDQIGTIMDLSNAQVQIAFYDEAKDEVSFPLAVEQDDGEIIDVVRWGMREPAWREPGEGGNVKQLATRARRHPPGLTEYVIHNRRSVMILSDFERQAEALGIRVWPTFGRLDRPTYSWLGVPMTVQDKVVGIISIQSLEQERAFDEGHLELLSTIAIQAAVAIENARLYAAEEKRVRQLKLIQRIALEISSQLELREVLKEIAEGANEVLEADFTTIFPYDKAHGFEAGIRVGSFEEPPSIPARRGWVSEIVETGEPLFVVDAAKDPHVDETLLRESGAESFIAYPIQFAGKPVGVMFVNFVEQRLFTDSEREWVEYLSNQAAVAIQNAKNFARAAEIERLNAANIMASDFIHRLGNFLGSIPPRIQMVESQFLTSAETCDPEQVTKELDEIVAEVVREQKELREALEIPLEQKPRRVDLNTLLQSVVIRVNARAPSGVRFHEKYEKGLPQLVCYTTPLFEAMRVVVQNAVDAVAEAGGGDVYISSHLVSQEDAPSRIKVVVRDTGPGIPEEQMPRMFELFYTTKSAGTGYGLWRARYIARQLGGDILVDSKLEEGTTFSILLPVERS